MGGQVTATRMRILGFTPFQIYPPHFGGAERCFNLLTRIPADNVLGISWIGESEQHTFGQTEYELIPIESEALQKSKKLQAQGFQTYDAMPELCRSEIRALPARIEQLQPDLIVLEHPWLVGYIPKGIPYIYDAHNAEADSFGQRFGQRTPEHLNVRALEKRAIEGATLITYCSETDVEILRASYNVTADTMHIPNGVTLPDSATPTAERSQSKTLLFVGSVYQPNVDAAQRLVNLAPLLRDWTIRIAGGCSYYVKSTWANVELLGHVTDEKLHELHQEAYAFVNLVTEGSGTHLKIGRALSYGIPVITTPIGARGYKTVMFTNGLNLNQVLGEIATHYDTLSAQGRTEAEALSWDKIVEPLRKHVQVP